MLLALVPYTAVPARAAGPVITLQPTDQYASLNTESVVFTVEAQGDGLKFHWFITDGKDGVTLDKPPRRYTLLGHVKSTANRSTMTLEMYAGVNWSMAGSRVYCEVIDSAGNTTTSNTATAHIRPKMVQDEPKDVTAAEGTSSKVTCFFVGQGLTYQWYILRPGSTRYEALEGALARTQSYPFTMSEEFSTARMYCEVTDRWGNTARSRVSVIRMTAPIRTNSLGLTFTAPVLTEALGTPAVTPDDTCAVKSVTAWRAEGGDASPTFQRGVCYSFEATLVPRDNYRFDNPVGVSAVSSDGFSGYTVLKALSPKELRVQIKYYAGLDFMYWPQGTLWAQAAGETVQACAKAYANNGRLYYALYRANGEHVETNYTGVFTITAQDSLQGYYINAADTVDGTAALTRVREGSLFYVGVKAKKELAITKQPDDVGLDDLGMSVGTGIEFQAEGESPLSYQLFDAETDELLDFSDAMLTAPADREGSYYAVVTDGNGDSLQTRTFRVYLRQRNPIDEVHIRVETPVGGADEKIVFLDENEEIVPIHDEYGTFILDYPQGQLYELTYFSLEGVKVPDKFVTGREYSMVFQFSVRDPYYTLAEGADDGSAWRFTGDTKFYVNGKEAQVQFVSSHNAGIRVSFTALDPAEVPQKLDSLSFTFTEPQDGWENTPPDVAVTGPGAELIGEASDLYWERENTSVMTHVELIGGFARFHAGETYRFTATFRAGEGYRFTRAVTASAIGNADGEDHCLYWSLEDGVLTVTARYKLPDPAPYSPDGSTLFFESNGGTPVYPITAPAGSALTEPKMPTRRDRRFAGWFRDEELQERFNFESMPYRDTTLYAKWIENEIEILRLTVNGSQELTDIPAGRLSFQADVKMSAEEAASVWVVVACYDANGRLLHLSTMTMRKSSDGTYTCTAVIDEKRDVARVSILILNREANVPASDILTLVSSTIPED